jgi:hypothetical protein
MNIPEKAFGLLTEEQQAYLKRLCGFGRKIEIFNMVGDWAVLDTQPEWSLENTYRLAPEPPAPEQPANLPDGAVAYRVMVYNGHPEFNDGVDQRPVDTLATKGLPRLGYVFGDDLTTGASSVWRNVFSYEIADWIVFLIVEQKETD